MTTDAHPKPQVLRVYPQPQTPRYWHRNGETNHPTIEGVFWFRGKLNHWRNGEIEYAHNVAGIETVKLGRCNMQDDVWHIPGEEGDHLLSDADGQWWGPIVSPWQGKK